MNQACQADKELLDFLYRLVSRINYYNILSYDVFSCVCCLLSGDAWFSGITRRQGKSADLG